MKKHWFYLRYLMRHRWYVFVECCKLGIPWRGVVHDLSKFRPSEWFPYVEWFYGGPHKPRSEFHAYAKHEWGAVVQSICKEGRQAAFEKAWLLHQHRNPHHWQHWILREDDGDTKCLSIPQPYLAEMLADWRGASRAIAGTDNPAAWYAENYARILLAGGSQDWIRQQFMKAEE